MPPSETPIANCSVLPLSARYTLLSLFSLSLSTTPSALSPLLSVNRGVEKISVPIGAKLRQYDIVVRVNTYTGIWTRKFVLPGCQVPQPPPVTRCSRRVHHQSHTFRQTSKCTWSDPSQMYCSSYPSKLYLNFFIKNSWDYFMCVDKSAPVSDSTGLTTQNLARVG